MNSWEKSDSGLYCQDHYSGYIEPIKWKVGENDHDLMMRLRNAGTDHRKFMRMITVYTDITAPLYWWKEFDTYKIGTVANSCSTMHKIHEKEFTLEDFSHEHLFLYGDELEEFYRHTDSILPINDLGCDIEKLNLYRKIFLETNDKKWWWLMIQRLPSNYNQKRTVMLNYEVLANIFASRKNHKLDEWAVGFMEWIESLPYSELISGPEIDQIKEEAVKKKMEVKINLNETVKFKLTDYGKDIYYHRFDELNERIVKTGGRPIEPNMPRVDSEGYTEMQLWCFMELYGKYMQMGFNNNVIEHLEIIYKVEENGLIEEEKNESADN